MLQYGGVQIDRVFSIRKTMNDLQHRSVEGRGMIKAKDVALNRPFWPLNLQIFIAKM